MTSDTVASRHCSTTSANRVPGDIEIKSDAEQVVVSDAIIDLAEIVDIVIDTINQEL